MFRKDVNLKIERIYNDYKKLIFTIAYAIVKDYDSAEDIIQETIRKMIENPCKAKELEGIELRNYVSKIARNTAIDYLKKQKRTSEAVSYIEDLTGKEITDKFDIEDFVITKHSVKHLEEGIRKLDDKYRDPLTLHNINKHTISEVSRLLNVPERTVNYRIKKAKQLLKMVLVRGDDSNE